jgi:hypothetical protein
MEVVDYTYQQSGRPSLEENVQLIIGKKLEAAIFKSKTTTL